MCSRQPAFEKASRQGIPWFQIDPIVEAKAPALIRAIIESDNTPNAIASKDAAGTLFQKCHLVLKEVFTDDAPDVVAMSKDAKKALAIARVQRSELTRKEEVPAYMNFVMDWSGGLEKPFILEEIDFHSKGVANLRDVNAKFVARLNQLDLGPANGGLLRAAAIKMAQDGSEKAVDVASVASLGDKKNKPHALKAESNMQMARKVLEDAAKIPSVNMHNAKKARDLMDKRLFKHLRGAKDFKDMQAICSEFLKAVAEAGGVVDAPSAWGQPASSNAPNASTAKRSIAELSATGPSLDSVLASLKQINCEVGAQISSCQDKITL